MVKISKTILKRLNAIVVFTGDEIEDYRKLIRLSGVATAQQTIKSILHRHLS